MGLPNWKANCQNSRATDLLLKIILCYWHTLRYLRPIQIYGRIWFKLYRPRPNLNPPPKQRKKLNSWVRSPQRPISLIDSKTFFFLNEKNDLAEIGWDGNQCEKLWRYNQHYFDDLNAVDSENRHQWHLDLLQDWIIHNDPTSGVGWEPYPTSLRIVNWIKWGLRNNNLPRDFLHSLAVQTRWLEKKLEFHLLGNHLLANAKALIFSGLFFDGIEADNWYRHGVQIFNREIEEQILTDGGHFELSPMYHSLVLEDLLDLVNLHRVYGRDILGSWEGTIPRMLTWLYKMCHPDGDISFFNDAAFDIAPSLSELRVYADSLEISCHKPTPKEMLHISDSGYVRFENSSAVLIADNAKVGPDYLPGHAHADTLSFELSVFGKRCLVNSGTSCYATSPLRQYQRGTVAHNTVSVVGENSSEVWGGFRVARRAKPKLKHFQLAENSFEIECCHDGYQNLQGKHVHYRKFVMDDKFLKIVDHLTGSEAPAVARFYFHPEVNVSFKEGSRKGFAVFSDNRKIEWLVSVGQAYLEETSWYPKFGISIKNQCLCIKLVDGQCEILWSWD